MKLKKKPEKVIRQKKEYAQKKNITVSPSLLKDFEEFQAELFAATGLKFTFSESCREGVIMFMQFWRRELKKAVKGKIKTEPKIKKRKLILEKS